MALMPYPALTVAELLISQPDGKVLAQRKLNPVRGYWIGRESSCDVVIDNPSVSRRHAFVFSANGRWMICDAGSMEGLETETGSVRQAALSADAWVGVGSVYIWLSGGGGKLPEWIDARATTNEAGGAPRLAKLAIEELGEVEPAPVAEVLTVSDAEGNIHLCADMTGLAVTKGGGSPRVTVGRANTMDIQLCHPSVEPLHCVLSVGSERWSLIDAGCPGGILWEGKRWFRKRMEEGISVPVGEFRLSMQRVLRTCAPIPPVMLPTADSEARAPRRPSAFLGGEEAEGDSLPMP
jgi:hypothetical protein